MWSCSAFQGWVPYPIGSGLVCSFSVLCMHLGSCYVLVSHVCHYLYVLAGAGDGQAPLMGVAFIVFLRIGYCFLIPPCRR